MAPRHPPRPTRPNYTPVAYEAQRSMEVQMPPPPPPRVYRARRPNYRDSRLRAWLQRTLDAFEQLILVGESQPSNGTVRKVCPPNGETTFAFAYGGKPDNDLRDVLKSIHDKHGEFTLRHDGRDSTGKHWITCYSQVKPGTFERPILKAVICVFSKLELATMPQPRLFSDTAKGKAIDDWLDKLPDAVDDSPDNLFSIPRLNPAAAKALRDKMEAEAWEWEFDDRKDNLRVDSDTRATTKGMSWNPVLFRWDGNEEALASFE